MEGTWELLARDSGEGGWYAHITHSSRKLSDEADNFKCKIISKTITKNIAGHSGSRSMESEKETCPWTGRATVVITAIKVLQALLYHEW